LIYLDILNYGAKNAVLLPDSDKPLLKIAVTGDETMNLVRNSAIVKKLAGCAGALVLAFATATAQAIPLGDLVAGGTITVGDKLFDNWEVFGNNTGAAPINLFDIEVTGDPGDPLNPGLIFTANNGALAVSLDFLTLNFGFQVTVLDPDKRIKDNTLALAGFSLQDPFDIVSIEETVCSGAPCFPGSPDQLAFKNVFADGFGEVLEDIQTFPGQQSIGGEVHSRGRLLRRGRDYRVSPVLLPGAGGTGAGHPGAVRTGPDRPGLAPQGLARSSTTSHGRLAGGAPGRIAGRVQHRKYPAACCGVFFWRQYPCCLPTYSSLVTM
jgi:hypothetical protein